MRLEIKNPALLISKLERVSKFLSHARVSFLEEKILFTGMNYANTLLVSLELGEEALVGYAFVKTDSYAFNISVFLGAVSKDATSLKLDFEAESLTVATDKGKATIHTMRLEHTEQREIGFDTSFEIASYITLFKELRLKAKGIYPIQLEGKIGEGMRMKVVVSPTEISLYK